MKKTVSAIACALITLCTASPLYARTVSHAKARSSHHVSTSSPYLQCVTFARQLSGIQIFGDAWTWWEKATDKYDEGHAPKPGAVLVFRPQGKMRLGHVAVVTQIITNRYIQVTHANWSPINGRRGQVEDHVNVLDVSDKGDWSKVKVWYGPLNDLGTTVYDTYGFIYNDTPQQVAAPETQPQAAPMAAPVQVAVTDTPATLPDDLKTALTPGNKQGFLAVKSAPVTVSAHVKGKSAAELVAQIDSDASDDAPKPVVRHVSETKHKNHAKKRTHSTLRHP